VAAVATVGVPPERMNFGPAPAIRRLLAGTGIAQNTIDRFEINEALPPNIFPSNANFSSNATESTSMAAPCLSATRSLRLDSAWQPPWRVNSSVRNFVTA